MALLTLARKVSRHIFRSQGVITSSFLVYATATRTSGRQVTPSTYTARANGLKPPLCQSAAVKY